MDKTDDDRYYPRAVMSWQNPKWADQKASTAKGETPALMEHLYQKVLNGDNNNTSTDSPWWVNPGVGFSDVYMVAVVVIFLVPVIIIFWIPLFVLLLSPVLLNRWYIGWIIPEPAEVVPRGSLGWKCHCLLQFILALPAGLLVVGILLYSNIVMAVTGGLYLVVHSILHLRSPTNRLFSNLQVLQPYQNGPSLLWHFEDCVIAVAGSVYRQHFFEFMKSFTNMFFINPWIKYWLTGNIYLEDLGERFLTQIGKALDDMDPADIDTHFLKAISRAKHTAPNRDEIDAKTFAPHYPYPPLGKRQYAIGMQFSSSLTNFVHTTHFRCPYSSENGPVASLSTSAALPVYRVLLWRNNPYHIFTGYVEANISTGWPTQPHKRYGGEHPMWLVNSHNKFAADRNVKWSLGYVDNFFDDLIPQISHFIRLNVRGREVADAYLVDDNRLGYEQENQVDYQKMAEF